MKKGYGWKPQLPDHRDRKFAAPRGVALPESVDLRPQMPPVYDQGNLSSCTANAIAAAVQYDLIKNNQPSFIPSRLYIYYNERNLEGDPSGDNGAMIRDDMIVVNAQGVVDEALWP